MIHKNLKINEKQQNNFIQKRKNTRQYIESQFQNTVKLGAESTDKKVYEKLICNFDQVIIIEYKFNVFNDDVTAMFYRQF